MLNHLTERISTFEELVKVFLLHFGKRSNIISSLKINKRSQLVSISRATLVDYSGVCENGCPKYWETLGKTIYSGCLKTGLVQNLDVILATRLGDATLKLSKIQMQSSIVQPRSAKLGHFVMNFFP